MLSSNKHISKFTNSTENRGVEAKQVKVTDTKLDVNTSTVTQIQMESNSGCTEHAIDDPADESTTATTPATLSETDSYIQVIVQKHRRVQNHETNSINIPEPSTPRLPKSSSPIKPEKKVGCGDTTNNGEVYMLPHPLLFAYPTIPHQPQTWNSAFIGRTLVETATSAKSSSSFKKIVQALRCENKKTFTPNNLNNNIPEPDVKNKTNLEVKNKGNKLKFFENNDNVSNYNPQRIEVYYFERGCTDYLSTTDCSSIPLTEKFVARTGHVLERILSEVCAIPQLLLAAPTILLVQTQKLILISLRNVFVDTTQTYSDYFLKPLLTVLFNALIQPPMVFVTNIAIGIRNVLKPLWGIFGDLIEPMTKLIGSLHLVRVEKKCNKCEQCV